MTAAQARTGRDGMTMASAVSTGNVGQAELSFLVEKNADGIIVVDENGTVLFANPATEEIFGRSPESLIGSPIGIPLVIGETTEITIHRPGGKQVEAEIRVVDTNWANRPARLASVRDISARKMMEEQLRHSSKMEAIGRLTAGIAHDFNNLLTVVLGNLEHAHRQVEDAALLKVLANAMRGARRAAVLTERLLAFARRKPLEPKLLNANVLVSRMSDLLQRTLGEGVKVRVQLADDLWALEVDPTELETAILNLAVNARDAMPEGGEVVIETKNIEIDSDEAAAEVELQPGPYVQISVTDTGTGMAPEVLRRVFEPFFTTKPAGRGTGLGLSQVYGFVKQSGGHVKIESEPGRGTVAKICLPKAATDRLTHEDLGPPIDGDHYPVGRRSESILVVEDDPDVRSYTVNSLRNLGYTVLEAADAATALRILESESGIALLFTDLGLPGGMDGKALAQRARQVRPALRVLITTAYAGDALVHEGRLARGIDLLSKPFSFAALAARVRSALDSADAPKSDTLRVLLVEDEPLIRMLVVDSLTGNGCVALEAANGKEALSIIRSEGANLGGAIVDVGLPDMSGEEVVAEIRAVLPDLPVILATGFANEQLKQRFAADAHARLMQKPYEPEALVGALRALRSAEP